MLPATDDVAPLPWRDHLAALGALRRGVAAQSSVDAANGVRARRILFSLGDPSGDMLAALDALDRFERAIVECDDPSAIEARRLNCLVILDRLAANSSPRA
ncbi:hypothetical protein FJW07_04600 [Mesorhizobium sp. B3-1-9]|uniref:hypothetical protein n=1 Tax=unclassified Mesorhizobium TaxID=325217 RepID=UPI001129E7FA|nr:MULTISPECIES: hypothetical protein [unclassified Mesorhizobium]TPI24518.1 hypothetical protein FJ414_31110 [Mesorhizobium sp. B3-1-6]TPI41795.1 hypothetical protein FJW07_04600 [Mesorhizobium sp. B3-1-9]TPI55686.1 hypothetical protein FJ417_23935 [Mesorhizobium sp. B3-1-7]TPI69121.1 hypothetical protein FJ424_06965 [Mesorhizobium sp. B3-1-8]TPI74888.1 hypothetical protein FJ420_04880 [Mesorhizobium sp. B3-1-3]